MSNLFFTRIRPWGVVSADANRGGGAIVEREGASDTAHGESLLLAVEALMANNQKPDTAHGRTLLWAVEHLRQTCRIPKTELCGKKSPVCCGIADDQATNDLPTCHQWRTTNDQLNPNSQKWLAPRIERKGCTKRRTRSGAIYQGIALKPQPNGDGCDG